MVATKQTELSGASTLLHEGRESTLGRCETDEPIFILRAQDRTSSKMVRAWVQEARDAGCTNQTKLEEALEWAFAAEKWRQARGGGKVPD